jgi:hypothetical protein
MSPDDPDDPDERPAERDVPARADREHQPWGLPIRIDPKMIVLLVVGMIAAMLIFWFEPSFTLRYVVVGALGVIYVFLRFNDWR